MRRVLFVAALALLFGCATPTDDYRIFVPGQPPTAEVLANPQLTYQYTIQEQRYLTQKCMAERRFVNVSN
jgi:hypothetical protein